jgi:hypothetical protein
MTDPLEETKEKIRACFQGGEKIKATLKGMTRDEARAVWIESTLTYDDLTLGRVHKLRTMMDKAMRESGLIEGYRMRGAPKASLQSNGFHIEMRCKAHYFENREAVTFNHGGFVGFAGWADERNVQPILSAFVAWVAWMKKETGR